MAILKKIMTWAIILAYAKFASILTTQKARLNGKMTKIHLSVPVVKLSHGLVAFLPLVTIISTYKQTFEIYDYSRVQRVM